MHQDDGSQDDQGHELEGGEWGSPVSDLASKVMVGFEEHGSVLAGKGVGMLV